MIRYVSKKSGKELIRQYLLLYNIMQPPVYVLRGMELDFMELFIVSSEDITTGDGRQWLCEELGVVTQQISRIIGGLVKKGCLIKEGWGSYKLRGDFETMRQRYLSGKLEHIDVMIRMENLTENVINDEGWHGESVQRQVPKKAIRQIKVDREPA